MALLKRLEKQNCKTRPDGEKMAKLYSHSKGKSGSNRPLRTGTPLWVDYGPEEIEKLIVKMGKKGLMPSEIGRKLRDEYGIPSVKLALKRGIAEILEESNIEPEVPEDLFFLLEKAVRLRKHLEKNQGDIHNRRQLKNTEMKIWRLVKYYKRTGKLPKGWNYGPERASLIVSGR